MRSSWQVLPLTRSARIVAMRILGVSKGAVDVRAAHNRRLVRHTHCKHSTQQLLRFQDMVRHGISALRLYSHGEFLCAYLHRQVQSDDGRGLRACDTHCASADRLLRPQEWPAPRGERKTTLVKYSMGLPITLLLILLVLSPLLAYSLLNRFGDIQRIERVELTIGLDGYPVSEQACALQTHTLANAHFSLYIAALLKAQI